MNRIVIGRVTGALLAATGLLLAGCSTVTPYTAEIAKESPHFGALTPAAAAQIIKTQTSVSGEIADYRSFFADEEGFGYTKTTESEQTEWKGNKPVKVKSTSTITRNIPWSAITRTTPYMEEYKAPFPHVRYRAQLDYDISSIKNASRVHEKEDIIFNCKTYEALTDVMAALQVLTSP